jgi:hypothetical protein
MGGTHAGSAPARGVPALEPVFEDRTGIVRIAVVAVAIGTNAVEVPVTGGVVTAAYVASVAYAITIGVEAVVEACADVASVGNTVTIAVEGFVEAFADVASMGATLCIVAL